ncbi:PSD1 and planctomycete cytochrome C domain-containing protein [Granulicella aggregans]|uniref:PSD1 and planctomycete cytochrome C domain-containing protein n=1 Tax=Granulicella aggregans TaxID=474949 RepID=UPI0021E063B7|nr:PSD1 and planctomycete cytochrome C domain-containing protein [Granulicella aggregans]
MYVRQPHREVRTQPEISARHRARAAVSILAVSLAATSPLAIAQSVKPSTAESFQQNVKPIIDRNCAGCHVLGGHSGQLRLDSLADVMKGGEDGAIVVFGKPEKSLLTKTIHYEDPDMQMPPKGKLSAADIATIDKWIAESAEPLPGELKGNPVPPVVALAPAPATVAPVASASAPTASAKATPVALNASSPLVTAEQEQFFETKVRPVLVNNCFSCHASAAKAGLRLDSREAVLAGGKSGDIVVPGHPEQSTLSTAVHYSDPKLQMPPRKALKPDEVAAIDRWIADGLPWPKGSSTPAVKIVSAAQRDFWAFKPPLAPAVPDVKSAWAKNDIDRFVLVKLDEKHLKPVADADKHTLIRRVTYDLTGLPPTPAEVSAFISDRSPLAYEHLVDRLLASKAYGERWGRIWLDVVRYADTSGGGGDYPIAQASKYRDYVIQSFNEDKPYDRFIKEQIAGDLLPSNSEPEHWSNIVATGYLANASRYDGAYLNDAVDNIGYAFMGMTVACARCHDHKFDPVPTSDYYAIYGILQSTSFPDPGDDVSRRQIGFVYRDPKSADRQDIKDFNAQLKPIAGAINAVFALPGTYDDILPQLEARRMNLYAHAPEFPENAYAVTEGQPRQAQIQLHGDPTNLGEEVPRGFLQVLGGGTLPADTKGSGRLQLADWIASKDNPLTARVLVNRLWQGHFGRGIVPTPNNFGTRGVAPSNQALLDYLATEFIAKGWSIKTIQREILLSHAYRLSTADSAANDEIDPDNALIWRHSRVRLDAEEIRDSMLADAKLLDLTPAKPHPFPPQSQWNWEEQNPFAPDVTKYENDHRTVYMMVQRSVKHPYLTLFDGADPNASTEQRTSSLTPLQALYFMNASFPRRCSDNLATQWTEAKVADPKMIEEAFMTIYGRPAQRVELDRSEEFLKRATALYISRSDTPDIAHKKAVSNFVQAMFSTNEFMFIE